MLLTRWTPAFAGVTPSISFRSAVGLLRVGLLRVGLLRLGVGADAAPDLEVFSEARFAVS